MSAKNDSRKCKIDLTVLEEVRYNPASRWGVYKFRPSIYLPFSSEEDGEKFYYLFGEMQQLKVNRRYIAEATCKYSRISGPRYNVIAVYEPIPQTYEQQLTFLCNFITKRMANRLLKWHPTLIDDVLNGRLSTDERDSLRAVPDSEWVDEDLQGYQRNIEQLIIDRYLLSDLLQCLGPVGVTYHMIDKMMRKMPGSTSLKQKIRDNPYVLIHVPEIRFRELDELALKIKPEMVKSEERLFAYIWCFLRDSAEGDGHTWCTEKYLRNIVQKNVPECFELTDQVLSANKCFRVDGSKIGLDFYYRIETQIVRRLREKAKSHIEFDISEEQITEGIREAEEEQKFKYGEEQIKVIRDCLHRNVSIVTGRAGTGKTSIMRAIIKIYSKNNFDVTASAFSAMAAHRITDATGVPAQTIHKTLECGIDLNSAYDSKHPLDTRVAFLDEASMVNVELFSRWIEAIGKDTRIIIAGDDKQLPPIGAGNVFSDLLNIMDGDVVSILTEPMRQAAESAILNDANLIRSKKSPIDSPLFGDVIHGKTGDMHYIFDDNPQTLFNIAIETYIDAVNKYDKKEEGLDRVAIVVPRKKDCWNSTFELNNRIQDILIPGNTKYVQSGKRKLKLGAKVIQTRNDYDNGIVNGDMGYIDSIGKNKDDPACVVKFKGACEGEYNYVPYNEEKIGELDLAYAFTVHKLQGGARQEIIGILDQTHEKLLDNCMLYTLLTRAKENCLLLAEASAFTKCIETSNNKRYTWMSLYMEALLTTGIANDGM